MVVDYTSDNWTFDIRILDQNLAIVFAPEFQEGELTVWDWESGEAIQVCLYLSLPDVVHTC